MEEAVKELGFQQLKPKQLEAIEVFVVGGKDVLVALPTGYGKSVLYGVLPTLYSKMRGMYIAVCICCSSNKIWFGNRFSRVYSGVYQPTDIHYGRPAAKVC